MKRKLILTFENNKLLHATITDRGRRMYLPKIITSADAVKEVKDALASAMSVMVPNPPNNEPEVPAPISVATFLVENFAKVEAESAKSLPAAEPEITTSITEAQTEMPDAFRARSVCARPKSDKKESSVSGKTFSERSQEDVY